MNTKCKWQGSAVMKKWTCLITAILVVASFIAGFMTGRHDPEKIAPGTYEHTELISTAAKSDCFLCGSGENALAHYDLRPNNLGVLDLNTLDTHYLEIVRYENGGVETSTASGVLAVGGMDTENGRISSSLDSDRGYCYVNITDANGKINRGLLQDRLCQDCLGELNTDLKWGGSPSGFAIVNYKDRTICPIASNVLSFGAGDYLVDCQFKDSGEIRLLIALLPNRYPEYEVE